MDNLFTGNTGTAEETRHLILEALQTTGLATVGGILASCRVAAAAETAAAWIPSLRWFCPLFLQILHQCILQGGLVILGWPAKKGGKHH